MFIFRRIMKDKKFVKKAEYPGGNEALKKFVKENHLKEHVLFEQERPHEQINIFYNEIDLFVLSSYYEAAACVLMEAWATDTLILSIKNQGIAELIPEKERKDLLAEEQSAESLKEKILIAYNNRRSYPFDEKYDIKNTVSSFLKLCVEKKSA